MNSTTLLGASYSEAIEWSYGGGGLFGGEGAPPMNLKKIKVNAG